MASGGTERLLIANRGEIAVRIARTARRLGISTVGIYSEPDRNALHVDMVDIAVALGGATPAESYLRGEAIIEAAHRTGSTAIHPGYGFLAENADFAQAVIEAGLVWVGPTPDQIRLLGDKIAAKQAAIAAGVPTTEAVLVEPGVLPVAEKLPPVPLLVKAAAGGGGRGMRTVASSAELSNAIEAASREALAAFGDGTVFVEPYIERGRHVEVQILADHHGNVVHLGDRECSIQRRNQKVVEEAPSPGIDEATRTRLHEGAVALAAYVGYHGAGTVEFMVSETDDDSEPTITFLEVNTRLQVEHPVTEMITGVDLVEMQIRIADGDPLPFTQSDVEFSGHAIEVRLVAEDPTAGWLPSTGRIERFDIDGAAEGLVRVDTGFRAGSEVSADYDSLLAKVIAHDADRNVAAQRIAQAMRQARIIGVRTNANMLAALMVEPDFRAGHTVTKYLDEHPEVTGASGPTDDDRIALLLAAVFTDEAQHRSTDRLTGFAPSGWRNLRTQGQRRSWLLGDVELHVEYELSGDRAAAWVGTPPAILDDGTFAAEERRRVDVRLLNRTDRSVALEFDGVRRSVDVDVDDDRAVVSSSAGTLIFERPQRFADHDVVAAGDGPICPLPGTVIAVHVTAGETVAAGDLLMVVEAMKMEHQITAIGPATIDEVRFATGDRVDQGDLLVALTANEGVA